MRESESEGGEGQLEEGGRTRGVTGLAGFVKAMHCKELTTAIPFLSPSYPPSRSRSLSPFDCASRLSLCFARCLFVFSPRSCVASLLSPDSILLSSSFSSSLRNFSSPLALSLPLSFSLPLSLFYLCLPPPFLFISSFLCRPLVRGGRVGARSLLVLHS